MTHHKIVFGVFFTLVAAVALLLPLTNAPEPTTWIASMVLITMGTAVARPARREERLPPGVA